MSSPLIFMYNQSFSEHRMQEYSKCRTVCSDAALDDSHFVLGGYDVTGKDGNHHHGGCVTIYVKIIYVK